VDFVEGERKRERESVGCYDRKNGFIRAQQCTHVYRCSNRRRSVEGRGEDNRGLAIERRVAEVEGTFF
jgi:hypothetical protein